MIDTLDMPPTLTLQDLEHALRQVEPAAMLLPSWLLENVIAADRGIGGPLSSIPHDQSHVISRERLLQVASDEELPLSADPPEQPVLILLARPDDLLAVSEGGLQRKPICYGRQDLGDGGRRVGAEECTPPRRLVYQHHPDCPAGRHVARNVL